MECDQREISEDQNLIQEHHVRMWNAFRDPPRKRITGSALNSLWLNYSVKAMKIITIIVVFVVVLGSALISKITLFLMVAQIKHNITRPYCNKKLDVSRQFVANTELSERSHWVWLLMAVYLIPEATTWIRSVRICMFKTWLRPQLRDFLVVGTAEICSAVGCALLTFDILPGIDAIRGTLLMNGFCFVPAVVGLFSTGEPRRLRYVLDVVCVLLQSSALIVWPVFDPALRLLPLALLCISIGWWQTFTSPKSPFQWMRIYATKELSNGDYFIYIVVIPMKAIVFVATAVTVITLRTWHADGTMLALFGGQPASSGNGLFDGRHKVNITEVDSRLADGHQLERAGPPTTIILLDLMVPVCVAAVHSLASYVCYAFAKFSCKVMIQGLTFALPLTLIAPLHIATLATLFTIHARDVCLLDGLIPSHLFFIVPELRTGWRYVVDGHLYLWPLWFISQVWLTVHIWRPLSEKLARTERIFVRPMYDSFFIDHSLVLNKRRDYFYVERSNTSWTSTISTSTNTMDGLHSDSAAEDLTVPTIYACATMWHETRDEMVAFLKSIFRLDADQCANKIVRKYLRYKLMSYFEFETHIFFDDAFMRQHSNDDHPQLNTYVKDLISALSEAASEVHETRLRIRAPTVQPTPYGGRLRWTLPGGTTLTVHLKDRKLVRNKKRWSQVMYMYYLLGSRLMANARICAAAKELLATNTYLLALDGDVDFQPRAVHLLVDYMRKNEGLGAACGRIHPVGGGAMAWYQKFEYAVGHWLQKATEHVIGCVLCSPGCFSLFRARALMDDGVMCRYATRATEARHYVQYDQGEDRWLCTLLLQRGYRVEYSAASDAYTHCPEGFREFYNQRRRWMPSTMANILDLLTDYKHTVHINDNISTIYVAYQAVLFVGTILGPGTIFLMLIGAFVTVFDVSHWTSLTWNLAPVLAFIVVCAFGGSGTQLFVAGILSAVYGLVMMAVFIGIVLQVTEDGVLAPTSLFLFCVVVELVVAALMHPQEFHCLKYGILYFVTVPSMYMLLVIYAIFNMNNVTWGTREVTVVAAGQNAPTPLRPPHQHVVVASNADEEPRKLPLIQSALVKLRRYVSSNNGGRRRNKGKSHPADGSHVCLLSDEQQHDQHDGEELEMNCNGDEEQQVVAVWYEDACLENGTVEPLEPDETTFWQELIETYLFPIEDDKVRIAKELKDLRDKVVATFFMLNTLFVLVIFILTLEKHSLHVNWPISPRINFTYYPEINEVHLYRDYLQLEPIGLVFLLFFAVLLIIQFLGMIMHRFTTYSQIVANTNLDFSLLSSNLNANGSEQTARNPLRIVYELQQLCGINEDDEDQPVLPVNRRKTVQTLAQRQLEPMNDGVYDLETAFLKRLHGANRKGSCSQNENHRKSITWIRSRLRFLNKQNNQRGVEISSTTIDCDNLERISSSVSIDSN